MKRFDFDNYGDHGALTETMPLNKLTFTGSSGTANVGVWGIDYLATFATSLGITARNFVSTHGAALKQRGITATNVLQSQVETITVTGSSGTATIAAAGGLTKTLTFDTNLTDTNAAFVVANAAAYLAVGITLTASTDTLIFTGTVAGVSFTAPTITNATGDLAGTVAHTAIIFSASVYFTIKIGHIGVTISAAVTGNLTGTLLPIYTPDFSLTRILKLTIPANAVINAPKNPVDNALVRMELTASGSYSVTWDTAYQFAGGTEHTQTASGLDILEGRYNLTADKVYMTELASDVKA